MPVVLSKASSSAAAGAFVLTSIRDRAAPYLSERQTNAALIVAAAGAGAWLLWRLLFAVPPNMPPGPRPLPLIGNIFNMGNHKFWYENFVDLRKQYGDIYTVYLGPMRMVALSNQELLRDAFIRQGALTSNRGYFPMADLVSNGHAGILLSNDSPRLKIQRKLAHSALRKFSAGGGIDRFLDVAFAAMSAQLDKDPQLDGVEMGFLVSYNMLLSMCFGKEFSFDDPFFAEWVARMRQLEKLFDEGGLWVFIPFVEYLPIENYRLVRELMDKVNNYFLDTMEDHRRTFDPEKLTDFTYHLLSVQKEAENDPEDKRNLLLLNDMNYMMIINDLFFAGTDTTRMTLNWIWHYLAAFPEVQRKAQAEVDSVVQRDAAVTSAHRVQLPYCDAVLHEVLRIKTAAPIGVFHETTADIKLGGYDIPKGTGLISNTWSMLLDERVWDDPEAFLPERWLDEDGRYVYQDKGFVPFSMGRRSCIGEAFVKVELLVLMCKLLQQFTLEPQPGYQVSVKHMDSMAVAPVLQKPIYARRR